MHCIFAVFTAVLLLHSHAVFGQSSCPFGGTYRGAIPFGSQSVGVTMTLGTSCSLDISYGGGCNANIAGPCTDTSGVISFSSSSCSGGCLGLNANTLCNGSSLMTFSFSWNSNCGLNMAIPLNLVRGGPIGASSVTAVPLVLLLVLLACCLHFMLA